MQTDEYGKQHMESGRAGSQNTDRNERLRNLVNKNVISAIKVLLLLVI